MIPTEIVAVRGRRVWDSRGRPTIEAELRLGGGAQGRAIAPAGASRGRNEAVDLRDGGQTLGGYDVGTAIAHVNGEIARRIVGMDARDQVRIDAALIDLDGTKTKSRLGGNAMVGVSLAALHAAASAAGLPTWSYIAGTRSVSLPLPEIQIFGGGAHAGRRIDIQDLMVIALKARSFAESLLIIAEIYRSAGEIMNESGRRHGVADEGGYWPEFATNEEALETLLRAIERAGCVPGDDIAISLDIAASEFGRNGRYRLARDGAELDSDGLCALLLRWIERFPIVSIEDPVAEDDHVGMRRFARAVRGRVQVVGDDYLVTDAARIERAASEEAVTCALIKPNQVGTVTETLAALAAAKDRGLGTIVSARSGETEDVSIVHLAIGWNAGQLKVGSFARSERMAKWNEALRIEESLGSRAQFAGSAALVRERRAAP